MESLSSSVSTVPSIDDYFAHKKWNPLLELLFHEQVSGIFESFVVEIDLFKIALFVILLMIYSATKKVRMILHDASSGTINHEVFF